MEMVKSEAPHTYIGGPSGGSCGTDVINKNRGTCLNFKVVSRYPPFCFNIYLDFSSIRFNNKILIKMFSFWSLLINIIYFYNLNFSYIYLSNIYILLD